jgi:hypothetical protein
MMDVSLPAMEAKTAEELAAMIHEDLSKVDGCPEAGVNVTVYGLPWNAMLMLGAAARPVRNKAELQGFFEIITERLQRLYDVELWRQLRDNSETRTQHGTLCPPLV